MYNIKFKVIENSNCIAGKIFYNENSNEFIFEGNMGIGEFSLMIGRGYCELSVARFNSRIYSFYGINFRRGIGGWKRKKLVFPNSIKGELYLVADNIDIIHYDGEWYVEDWRTYYDKKIIIYVLEIIVQILMIQQLNFVKI